MLSHGFRSASYMCNLQEKHENMIKKKGGNQPLEWSNYNSMTFTQCVMISLRRILKLLSTHAKNTMPPHFLENNILGDISAGDK